VVQGVFKADEFAEQSIEAGMGSAGLLGKHVVECDFAIKRVGSFFEQAAGFEAGTRDFHKAALNGREALGYIIQAFGDAVSTWKVFKDFVV